MISLFCEKKKSICFTYTTNYNIFYFSCIHSFQYDEIYVCQKCAEGCETCNDSTACLSSYNWAFRVSLLTISIICIFFTGVLAGYIYKYRKLKVFKVASPIFLCITLLGCAIMYTEVSVLSSFFKHFSPLT